MRPEKIPEGEAMGSTGAGPEPVNPASAPAPASSAPELAGETGGKLLRVYLCPVCGGKLRTEADVRKHAERHGEAAYRRNPSFAPRSVYVEWYFAYIWMHKKEVKEDE